MKVYANHGHFLASGKEETIAIGEEINSRFGFTGMKYICNLMRGSERLGKIPARELEMAWHGIGDWLG